MKTEALKALVIAVSTRVAAGLATDRAGPLLVEGLRALDFAVAGPLVVPDGELVEQELRKAVAVGYDVVLTTGGTGLTPTDLTPEMTQRVLDRQVPGIAEALRRAGARHVATSVLSRGLAGVAGRTLVVNLPGSPGGCRDGLAVLTPILTHAVSQIAGGDHVPGGEHAAATR